MKGKCSLKTFNMLNIQRHKQSDILWQMDSQSSKRNAYFHQNLLLVIIIIANIKTVDGLTFGQASYPYFY